MELPELEYAALREELEFYSLDIFQHSPSKQMNQNRASKIELCVGVTALSSRGSVLSTHMIALWPIFRAEQVVADSFGRVPSGLALAHASFASSASFHPSSASSPASSQAMFLARFLKTSPASSDSPSSCRPASDAAARPELDRVLAAFDPASFASFPASSALWPASVPALSARWPPAPAALRLAESVAPELTVVPAIAAPAWSLIGASQARPLLRN